VIIAVNTASDEVKASMFERFILSTGGEDGQLWNAPASAARRALG